MCCKNCEKKQSCVDSIDYADSLFKKANKEDPPTIEAGRALHELSRRLNLAPEVILDNLKEISEILEWSESPKKVPRA